MKLHFYNDRLQHYNIVDIPPYSNIEKAIMYFAIQLYGDGFYSLIQHDDDLMYTLNGDISCIVSLF